MSRCVWQVLAAAEVLELQRGGAAVVPAVPGAGDGAARRGARRAARAARRLARRLAALPHAAARR